MIQNAPTQQSSTDNNFQSFNGAGRAARRSDYQRHSREDALTERDYIRLLQGAAEIENDTFAFQARAAILLAGRLGLRVGEIAHLHTDWIHWPDGMIDIPDRDPCTKGQDGGICGDCRNRAQDRVDAHNVTVEQVWAELDTEFSGALPSEQLQEMAQNHVDEHNITFEQAAAERWQPKTPESARAVPFDFNVRVELCLERFADRYDEWPTSKCTINRRVTRAAERAGIEGRVYPHALRATAASSHASRSVSAYALMSIMGWQNIQTARNYIRASDETAAKELRSKYR